MQIISPPHRHFSSPKYAIVLPISSTLSPVIANIPANKILTAPKILVINSFLFGLYRVKFFPNKDFAKPTPIPIINVNK